MFITDSRVHNLHRTGYMRECKQRIVDLRLAALFLLARDLVYFVMFFLIFLINQNKEQKKIINCCCCC